MLDASGASPAGSPADIYSCYLDRYPDLAKRYCKFNKISRCNWEFVARHWEHHGSVEGRIRDCNFSQKSTEAKPLRKWVFTIAGNSPAYDEMTRVAVISAKQRTTLTPIGLVTGEFENSQIIPWLQSQGIPLIFHTPAWKDHIVNASMIARKLGHHISKSPLYGDPQMMLATFLRLDLGVMSIVSEDPYVLYADVDVIFTGDVRNEDFGPGMPQYFTMGVEMEPDMIGRISGNAGVLLLNVQGMRETHDELVSWVFSEENMAKGLYFGDFGPGDQGALKAFYWERRLLRTWPRFNWKPYWGYTPEAKIVHFHGPKPADYVNFFANASEELQRHALYAYLYNTCKVEPAPPEVAPERLAGAGCAKYVELWQNWSKAETRRAAPSMEPRPAAAAAAESSAAEAAPRNFTRPGSNGNGVLLPADVDSSWEFGGWTVMIVGLLVFLVLRRAAKLFGARSTHTS